MDQLDKVRGQKGCKKCPGLLEALGKDLVLTAHRMFRMKEKGWQIPYERAVGVFMAIGLLRHGVPKEGMVQAEIPPPPDADLENWRGGYRFFKSTETAPAQEMLTNPHGRAPVNPMPPAPKRKRKPKKQGTARKGFQTLSMEELRKRREGGR